MVIGLVELSVQDASDFREFYRETRMILVGVEELILDAAERCSPRNATAFFVEDPEQNILKYYDIIYNIL